MQRTRPAALHPRLTSLKTESRNPINMSRFDCSEEERIMLEKLAISIFADCCNAGLSLRDSLAAVLLSGMDWGIQSTKEVDD